MISHGIDVNIQDENGYMNLVKFTMLSFNSFEKLIKFGTDVNAWEMSGKTALTITIIEKLGIWNH